MNDRFGLLLRRFCVAILVAVSLCAVAAPWLAPYSYEQQFRDSPGAPLSVKFLLGTDELGRDRFSRLLYGTGISLALAVAASVTSVFVGLLFSLAAPVRSATLQYGLSTLSILSMSIPWIFPFIVLRSLLPLNTAPIISIVLTFALIGIAGWPYPGRIFSATMREIANADWLLLTRASGIRPQRVFFKQVLPYLGKTAAAQVRTLIPAYILSEASLGLLGLGVAEPLPSWGNMLTELEVPEHWKTNPAILAPLVLLVVVMICLEVLSDGVEKAA